MKTINNVFSNFLIYFNAIGFVALLVAIILIAIYHSRMKTYIEKIGNAMIQKVNLDSTSNITMQTIGFCHFRIYFYTKMLVAENHANKEIFLFKDYDWDKVFYPTYFYQKFKPIAASVIPLVGLNRNFQYIAFQCGMMTDPICKTWDEFRLIDTFNSYNKILRNVYLGMMKEVFDLNLYSNPLYGYIDNPLPLYILNENAYDEFTHAVKDETEKDSEKINSFPVLVVIDY